MRVSSGIGKDELQTAIELSLQESHSAEEEEREFHRYGKICFLHNTSSFLDMKIEKGNAYNSQAHLVMCFFLLL